MKTLIAAAFAASLALPISASAITVDEASNLTRGGTYDLADGPFFWGATFLDDDSNGSAWFNFDNSGSATLDAWASGTILQVTGAFDFLWASWRDGERVDVASGDTAFITLSSRLAGGESDRLLLKWGAVQGDFANIDMNVDVSAVPIPAGFGLLIAALAGMGVMGRRKTA